MRLPRPQKPGLAMTTQSSFSLDEGEGEDEDESPE